MFGGGALKRSEARALTAICRSEGLNVRLFIRQAVLSSAGQLLEDSDWAAETREFIRYDGGRAALDRALAKALAKAR